MTEGLHAPPVHDRAEASEPPPGDILEEDALDRIPCAEIEDLLEVGFGKRLHRRILHEAKPTD